MPAAVKRAVAPASHDSNTAWHAIRSGSLVLATSNATVSIGQAST